MFRTIAVFGIAALLTQSNPKPPKQTYDAKKDETTYSSGDIQTGGLTGMSAEFHFAGKTFAMPQAVTLGVGSLRTKKDKDENAPDTALLRWTKVDDAKIECGGVEFEVGAKPGWHVSRNSMVNLMYGHAVEEYADIELTPAQFHTLAQSEGFVIRLGSKSPEPFLLVEERKINSKQLKSLRALDATWPQALNLPFAAHCS